MIKNEETGGNNKRVHKKYESSMTSFKRENLDKYLTLPIMKNDEYQQENGNLFDDVQIIEPVIEDPKKGFKISSIKQLWQNSKAKKVLR